MKTLSTFILAVCCAIPLASVAAGQAVNSDYDAGIPAFARVVSVSSAIEFSGLDPANDVLTDETSHTVTYETNQGGRTVGVRVAQATDGTDHWEDLSMTVHVKSNADITLLAQPPSLGTKGYKSTAKTFTADDNAGKVLVHSIVQAQASAVVYYHVTIDRYALGVPRRFTATYTFL